MISITFRKREVCAEHEMGDEMCSGSPIGYNSPPSTWHHQFGNNESVKFTGESNEKDESGEGRLLGALLLVVRQLY